MTIPFYATDTIDIGHLSRALAVAQAIRDRIPSWYLIVCSATGVLNRHFQWMGLFLVLMGLLLVGCRPPVSDLPSPERAVMPVETPTPTLAEPAVRIPTTTPIPTAPLTLQPTIPLFDDETPTPDVPLEASGPWLVFSVVANEIEDLPGGLWAVNPDGTGLTRVADNELVSWLDKGVSPNGGLVAFITITGGGVRGLTLNLVTLPGESQEITPLVSADIEAHLGQPHSENPAHLAAYDAAWAIVTGDVAWSPEGRRLTFIGALDGPSADVYMYSLDTGAITRLSDEPDQAIRPSWSSDGRYLVYGVCSFFGHGEGAFAEAIWVAQVDGSGARMLYEPAPGGEDMLGWAGPATIIVASWSDKCGRHRLRTVNIETGEARVLWDAHFERIARDPVTGTLLIAVEKSSENCDTGSEQGGLYFLAPGDTHARRISEYEEDRFTQSGRLHWSAGAERFFAPTHDKLLAISTSGDVTKLSIPSGFAARASPDGSLIAWIEWIGDQSGLLIGPLGQPPKHVSDLPVYEAAWKPDGQSLFFVFDGLYVAKAPDFIVVPIVEDILIDDLAWVP